MSEPVLPVPRTRSSTAGKLVDLLVIVVVAAGLLYGAWSLARSPEHAVPTQVLPELPELQPQLSVAGQGMTLTKESVSGTRQQANEVLRSRCVEVLQSRNWVLPLEITEDEQEMLSRCTPDFRRAQERIPEEHAIYSMPGQAGLIGIRESVVRESTSATANRHPQPLSQGEWRAAGQGAANGRRVVCWGLVVSDGASGHSIWFARPALSLPAASLEGSAP